MLHRLALPLPLPLLLRRPRRLQGKHGQLQQQLQLKVYLLISSPSPLRSLRPPALLVAQVLRRARRPLPSPAAPHPRLLRPPPRQLHPLPLRPLPPPRPLQLLRLLCLLTRLTPCSARLSWRRSCARPRPPLAPGKPALPPPPLPALLRLPLPRSSSRFAMPRQWKCC